MPDYTVISDVGESIVNVLWQEILADPTFFPNPFGNPGDISLDSPADLNQNPNNTVRLSVYLYRVMESAYTKNRFPVQGPGGQPRKPPLSLELSYLVTPILGTPRDQQILLGKVMQVLYDRAILEGADLTPPLVATEEEIRVVLNPVSLEEVTRVWQALDMPYRLSVCYSARVAMVDSRRLQIGQPVTERVNEYQGA